MEKPLDTKLSSRIKQVFDDFEDPEADAGWRQLREKYPEHNGRPIILWMRSAAAVLILATALWFMDRPEPTIAIKSPKHKNEVQNRATQTVTKAKDTNDVSDILKEGTALNQGKETPGSNANAQKLHVPVKTDPLVSAEASPALVELIVEKEIPLGKNPEKVSIEVFAPVKETALAFMKKDPFTPAQIGPAKNTNPDGAINPEITSKDISGLIKLSEASTLAAIMAKNELIPAKLIASESPNESTPVFKKEDQITSSDIPLVNKTKPSETRDLVAKAEGNKLKKAEATGKSLAFSVFGGSFYNYSEGSENQLNFGAGFSSDIRLGKRLKLSTGISIASNSLKFSDSETHNLPQSVSASLSTSGSSYNDASILTTITGYKASLLAFDIPVNLKYQLNPESDKIYLSAGFSSGTYLNEIYDYRYRRFNAVQGSYVSETQGQKVTEQLNDFDFARTLNFSAGFSTAFGKKQSISIEPFLKYPLGGLGSQDLKFGSTGINLKLRFAPLKK